MCVQQRIVPVKGGTLHKLFLTERAAELLFYLHQVFGPAELEEPEFCDVNPTLARCTQNGSPWKVVCPTLTGASQMCARYKVGATTVVRPLSGRECMCLIGWHPSTFSMSASMDDVLLRNFAGNAFSAFQFVPMLMMAIAGLQTIEAHDASTECEAMKDEGGADEESLESD